MRDNSATPAYFYLCLIISGIIHAGLFIYHGYLKPQQEYAATASENELAVIYVDVDRSSGAKTPARQGGERSSQDKQIHPVGRKRLAARQGFISNLRIADRVGDIEISKLDPRSLSRKAPLEESIAGPRPQASFPHGSAIPATQAQDAAPAVPSRFSVGTTRRASPLGHVNVEPEYPPLARRRGWEGTVVLKLRVEPDGRVSRTLLQSSSGRTILDQAALRGVAGWRFDAAQHNGIKVASWISQPVEFRLNARAGHN